MNGEWEDLPWQAMLNCECDNLVELAHKCHICNTKGHHHYTRPPGFGACLYIQGTHITAHLAKAVKEATYRTKVFQYICKNANWVSTDIFHMVDWQAREQALGKYHGLQNSLCSNLNLTTLQQITGNIILKERHRHYPQDLTSGTSHLLMFFNAPKISKQP